MHIKYTLLGVAVLLYAASGMADTLPQPLPLNVIADAETAADAEMPEAFILLHEEGRKRLFWHTLPVVSVKQMALAFFPDKTFLTEPMLLTQPVIASQPKLAPTSTNQAIKTLAQPNLAEQATMPAQANAQVSLQTHTHTTAPSQLRPNSHSALSAVLPPVASQSAMQPAPTKPEPINQVLVKRLASKQAPERQDPAKPNPSVETTSTPDKVGQLVVNSALVQQTELKQAALKEVTHRIKTSEELLRQQHVLQLSYQLKQAAQAKLLSAQVGHAPKVSSHASFNQAGWPKLQISQMRISSEYRY
ncbi:MAG TPA: hypothetical protein VGD04_05350 [Methylophilus sp.]